MGLWIAGIILILLIVIVICIYNKLVRLRNRVKNQWAQIDVQLNRRFDLIPNLVEVVKGYARHEQETLVKVMEARNVIKEAKTSAECLKADQRLTSMLPNIYALAENYPGLTADSNFLELQRELSDTETKIAYARQFYNDTVMRYHDGIHQFPASVIARIFGFKEKEIISIDDVKRQNVKVEMGR